MLNTTKKELIKDFQGATDFDQSTLFKKIYEEEYGSFGGAPYSALIGDFEFDRTPSDMYLLEQISHVAAAAHAPFISAADPNMFGLESYTDIDRPRDVSKIFETAEYVQWRSFRDSEDARYVALTMPRVLGRLPYHPKEGTATEGFNFAEDVTGQDHHDYLWMNAAYAFGTRLTNAFDLHGGVPRFVVLKVADWSKACLYTPLKRMTARWHLNAQLKLRLQTVVKKS